jgi:hypothetical protein
MRNFLRLITALIIAILLSACGGGGDSTNSSSSTTPASTVSLTTPAGTQCANDFNNTDVFGNIIFTVSHPINASPWGCLIVDKASNQPVNSGSQSVRFEIRSGDCSASTSFNDCVNDRSRWEIFQNRNTSTAGQIITYEYAIYIPAQAQIQPPPKSGGYPSTVLTQINWECLTRSQCSSIGTNGYGALAFLKIDYTGTLSIQTHQDFTWTPSQTVTVDSNPYNKWIRFRYVMKSTTASDGYIQIYANDKLVINETRTTLPNSAAFNTLRVGIYNSFISATAQPWQTQVVYFDSFGLGTTNF